MQGIFYYSEYSDPEAGRVQFCCGERDDVIARTVEHLAENGQQVWDSKHTHWVIRRLQMEASPGQALAAVLAKFRGVPLVTDEHVFEEHMDDRATITEVAPAYEELVRRYGT
jgi:hypothetical protein